MRGELRKGNSGHNSVPKSARRTEPSPRNPRFAAHLRCVSAKEGLGESRGGKGTIRCPCPLLPPPPGGGNTQPCHGEYPPAREGLSRLRRQAAGSAEGLPSAEGKGKRRFFASTGCAAGSAEGLPSAADQAFKDLQSLLQRLFLKSLAFHPAVRYNKTTRRGKAFTSRISLTALSHRKGAKAIRTAGSNAEHGNFVALLNFYKLAD